MGFIIHPIEGRELIKVFVINRAKVTHQPSPSSQLTVIPANNDSNSDNRLREGKRQMAIE